MRNCNYFSTLENGVDQAHVPFTHAKSDFHDVRSQLGHSKDHRRGNRLRRGDVRHARKRRRADQSLHHAQHSLHQRLAGRARKNGWREAFAWRVPVDDVSHHSFNIALGARERRSGAAISRAPTSTSKKSSRSFLGQRGMAAAVLAGKLSVHDIEERPDHRQHSRSRRPGRARARLPTASTEQLGPLGCRGHPHAAESGGASCSALAEGKSLKQWSPHRATGRDERRVKILLRR